MLTDILTEPARSCRRGDRPALLSILLLGMLLAAAPARSVEVDALYTVQVPFANGDPAARESAYADALRQILVRITGSREAALSPELTGLFPDPGRYVLQFQAGDEDMLSVSMDGAAIERIVRQTGFPVWGSDRPATLLWLAVDWGQGERELVAADDPDDTDMQARTIDRDRLIRERVREAARERGVPLILPLLDTEDFEKISFSDVWGGFNERLLEASRRYGASAVLVGRLRPGTAQRNRWSFYFRDDKRQWSGEPEEAIDLLADTLAAQLAVAGNTPIDAVELAVSGIDSVVAYGEVQQLLGNLGVVERAAVVTVEGNRIVYRVDVNGGANRLSSALDFSGKLTRARAAAGGSPGGPARTTLEYVYNP